MQQTYPPKSKYIVNVTSVHLFGILLLLSKSESPSELNSFIFPYFKLVIRVKNDLQSLLGIHKAILGCYGIKIQSSTDEKSQNK